MVVNQLSPLNSSILTTFNITRQTIHTLVDLLVSEMLSFFCLKIPHAHEESLSHLFRCHRPSSHVFRSF